MSTMSEASIAHELYKKQLYTSEHKIVDEINTNLKNIYNTYFNIKTSTDHPMIKYIHQEISQGNCKIKLFNVNYSDSFNKIHYSILKNNFVLKSSVYNEYMYTYSRSVDTIFKNKCHEVTNEFIKLNKLHKWGFSVVNQCDSRESYSYINI